MLAATNIHNLIQQSEWEKMWHTNTQRREITQNKGMLCWWLALKMRQLLCNQNKSQTRWTKRKIRNPELAGTSSLRKKTKHSLKNNTSLAVFKLWSSKLTLVPNLAQLFELWFTLQLLWDFFTGIYRMDDPGVGGGKPSSRVASSII